MTAKFTPPVPRSKMIGRNSLLQSSQAHRRPKLTLIAAPAGFGKTTLLLEWREALVSEKIPVAWLSLRSDDMSSEALLKDLVEAIQFVLPNFGSRTKRIIKSTSKSDLTRTLSDLVDDIADVAEPLVVFLDDYHNISNQQTDELIELLLNLAPENFQMVVASRTRPQFGLAALRVRDELQEITPVQLRFTLAESTEFLNKIRNLELNQTQIEKIHEHSEGWVAGLQLASLSLRDPHRRDGFIDSFSGRLQDIAEYLSIDVLSQQSEEVQSFLLRTSITDRLSGDLAEYLIGDSSARDMLQTVERDGLFVTPMDREQVWFRYHQLFHEFLATELRRRHPGEVVGLYQKASAWHAEAGLYSEAVEYGLLASDFEKVTSLVEHQSWEELKAGQMPKVIAWIRRIPQAVRNQKPGLLYLLGTALYHANKADESEETLNQLIIVVDGLNPEVQETLYLREQIRVLTSGIAIARDDSRLILEELSYDFQYLNDFEQGLACSFRGYAFAEMADFSSATKTLQEARSFHQRAGSEFGVIYADCFLALADFSNGNLHHCIARFSPDGNDISVEKYVAPVPQVIKGIVLYQWNQLDEALALLQPNLPLIEEVGFTKLLVFGYTALARISGLRGDHRAAMRCYDRIFAIGARWGAPYERHRILVEGGRIAYLLQAGHLNEAIDHALSSDIDVDAETWELPSQWERVTCRQALTWARLQIATGREKNTLPVLKRLRELATESRRGMRVLECFILEARARFDEDMGAARALIEEALKIAAPNNSVRCFVDEGSEIDRLLLDSREGDTARWPMATRSFLDVITNSIHTEPTTQGENRSDNWVAGLIEPVSERERNILKLIAEGSTNSKISGQLFISQNTVKWHLKNIFGKLGVNNRTSAVAVARQLNLLT